MKHIIKQQCQKLFGTETNFCKEKGINFSNFHQKIKTAGHYLIWLERFFEPLNIEVIIKEKENINNQ